MQKQFLSLIAAGLMLNEASQIQAMDWDKLPSLFHTQEEQNLLLQPVFAVEKHLEPKSTDKKRTIDHVDHDDDNDDDDDNDPNDIFTADVNFIDDMSDGQSIQNGNNNNNASSAERLFKCPHCAATF